MRDYAGVKLFAQKILSVLPDDFCAQFYVALSERYSDNDTAFLDFLKNSSFDGVTPDERKEVVNALAAAVEPKYLDVTKEFIERAYPSTCRGFDALLDRNIKLYIQKLQYSKITDRDVYICHRTAELDQDVADAVCTRLEERGLRCWIAPRNILAGSQNYERDILKGVESCRVFLLISSFKSIYSSDCEMELRAAALAGKALYSYRIDDTPYDGVFEKALSEVQWLDAQDDPFAHLEQLVIDIKGILARDEREKAELEEKRLAAREKERLLAEERRNKDQERLERLERIISGETAAAAPASVQSGLRAKLKRAELEIQAQSFTRAQSILDEVLDVDPECSQAWWLLILCDYKLTSDEELIQSGIDFTTHRYFKNAERFTDDEPLFERRLQDALASYKAHVVRAVNRKLNEAERLMNVDNFSAMSDVLSECASAFADEKNMVYSRFPDVVSRYFWLKLWAKYGQTPLVCVEDITREHEYETAMRYASPAQALEYIKARDTVSKNAELFLRERSKNRTNDGKLSDYLVDNKNILSTEVYSYYSSLLYFRKMLTSLHMTEEQLKASTVDISTNEYFMLASSLATDEQKREYDEILISIERNREARRQSDNEARSAAERERTLANAKSQALKTVIKVLITVSTTLAYIFALVAFTEIEDMVGDHHAIMFIFMALACGICRIVSDALLLATTSRKLIAITFINVVITVILLITLGIPVMGVDWFIQGISGLSVVGFVPNIVCLILEIIKIKKYESSKR